MEGLAQHSGRRFEVRGKKPGVFLYEFGLYCGKRGGLWSQSYRVERFKLAKKSIQRGVTNKVVG